MFFKKIKKLLFSLSILSIPFVGIGVLLVSCSSTSPTKSVKQTFKLYIQDPSKELLKYTILEWENKFTNHDFNEFKESISSFLDENKINFEFSEQTMVNVITPSTQPNSPILQNINFEFINPDVVLSVYINNMYIFADNYFDKPDLSIVSKPIMINQKDLPQIYDTDPTLVLDSEWINSINAISPANTIYIPNTIYYLSNRCYIETNIYQLVFSVNPQYSSMVNLDEFPDITFHVLVSNDIDKKFEENFTLYSSDILKFFGTNVSADILSMTNSEIFNCLANYVLSLKNVAPLVNCLDNNNNLYNYLIINQDINISILIQFSSYPYVVDSTIYFYKFLLKF